MTRRVHWVCSWLCILPGTIDLCARLLAWTIARDIRRSSTGESEA